MNYEVIYASLIRKRQEFVLSKKEVYCERHHILPRSLGGDNSDSNMVLLTAREHYVAHLLLVKIMEQQHGPNSREYFKMLRALNCFSRIYHSNIKRLNEINFNSRIYAILRLKMSKELSNQMKGKYAGSKNPMYGRHRTEEEKEKIRRTRLARGCGVGSKNPMYGKSCTYKMSPEENKDRIERIRRTMTGKKCVYLKSDPTVRTLINKDEIDKYLEMGYVLGQVVPPYQRNARGCKYMFKDGDIKTKTLVRPGDFEAKLAEGYVFFKKSLVKQKNI